MDVSIFRQFFRASFAVALIVLVSNSAEAQFGGPGGTGGGGPGGSADHFCFSNFGGPSCENVIIDGEECCDCVGGDQVEMHTCPVGPEPPLPPETPQPPPRGCPNGGDCGAESLAMVGGTAIECAYPAIMAAFSAETTVDMEALPIRGGTDCGGDCGGSGGGSGGG